MGSIDSKKLNQALTRAQNIGIVELPFTIGDADLVLRSLRSEDYIAALKDCDGLPEEEYIPRYQRAHVARAIVELNGVDLRNTRFVVVDEQEKSGSTKKIKLELHDYLTTHMLNTWGKEALDVAYTKLMEVLELAERQAKEGVVFVTPDETAEEKFRRLLLETRAAEKDLPDALLDKILDDQGLMRKSTAEEIKRAMSRADDLAREQAKAAPTVEEEPTPVVEPPGVPDEPPPAPVERAARTAVPDPHVTLQQAMAARRVPEVRSEQQVESKPTTRAAQIAAIEGEPQEEPDVSSAVSLQSGSDDVVEIRQAPIDTQALTQLVDHPPVAGINPRFRPPQRA